MPASRIVLAFPLKSCVLTKRALHRGGKKDRLLCLVSSFFNPELSESFLAVLYVFNCFNMHVINVHLTIGKYITLYYQLNFCCYLLFSF